MMKNAWRITVARVSGWKKRETTCSRPKLAYATVGVLSIDRSSSDSVSDPSLCCPFRYSSSERERIIPCVSLSLFSSVLIKKERKIYPPRLEVLSFVCCVVCYTFQLQRDFLRNNETARERETRSLFSSWTHRENFVWSPVLSFSLSAVLQFLSGKWISLSLQFIHLLERRKSFILLTHIWVCFTFLSRLMVSFFTKIDRLTFFLLAPSIHFLCQIL